MMNARISRDKILFFNTHWIYFLKRGWVFRGRRSRNSCCRGPSMESHRDLFVKKDSVEKVEYVWFSHEPGFAEQYKILQRYGVEIRKGRKK